MSYGVVLVEGRLRIRSAVVRDHPQRMFSCGRRAVEVIHGETKGNLRR